MILSLLVILMEVNSGDGSFFLYSFSSSIFIFIYMFIFMRLLDYFANYNCHNNQNIKTITFHIILHHHMLKILTKPLFFPIIKAITPTPSLKKFYKTPSYILNPSRSHPLHKYPYHLSYFLDIS